MASTIFFDPVVALRAAPLVSTTCTLLFAYEQHFFLSLFNRSQIRLQSKCLLPSYLTAFFNDGVVQVLGFLSTTAVTSLANLYRHKHGSLPMGERGAYWWYAATAGFAFSHLLYVPLVAGPVLAIKGQRGIPEGRDVNDVLNDWLGANRIRMVTVDLAAWIAAVIAVGKTLRA